MRANPADGGGDVIWKRLLLAVVLPIATAWARRQERRILRAGEPLHEQQLADARLVGVAKPERVRVLVVERVPPGVPLVASRTVGMALGYGIFLQRDSYGSRALLLHELAHTAQYERLGFRGAAAAGGADLVGLFRLRSRRTSEAAAAHDVAVQ